jgi:chromatin segregation and condensation protein Rec8/ScpA/Scc1 (kleisin family)
VSAPCSVKLDLFEGPLDLLLHLIKKSEVEVADIPIAAITDQYLAMIEGVSELNLDNAGEYLVMAATLTFIKSRMLLPAAPGDDDDEEDPRTELVQQLLEYQRYREAAAHLSGRPLLERDVFITGGELPEPPAPGEEGPLVRDATLGDLLEALRGVSNGRRDRSRTRSETHARSACAHDPVRFALRPDRVHRALDADTSRGDVIDVPRAVQLSACASSRANRTGGGSPR